MKRTTEESIVITKFLPSASSSNYVESQLHIEVVNPNGTVKWMEGTEIAFEVINSVQGVDVLSVLPAGSSFYNAIFAALAEELNTEPVGGSITFNATLPTHGKYKFNLYNGVLNGDYSLIGSVRVERITNDVIVQM